MLTSGDNGEDIICSMNGRSSMEMNEEEIMADFRQRNLKNDLEQKNG